jgi:RNA polymerase sigma factor (TIGR02999 family)
MPPEKTFQGLGVSDPLSKLPGENGALDQVFSASYEELHRLAGAVKHRDGNATLSTTTLVNEAWLRLRNSPDLAFDSALHFKNIAARAMRQILVEAARRRNSQKRGGNGSAVFVTLDDSTVEAIAANDKELLAVDAALNELGRMNPRQAKVVECRFFGGLEISEIAEVLGTSEATVLRDWRAARAWLASEIRKSG